MTVILQHQRYLSERCARNWTIHQAYASTALANLTELNCIQHHAVCLRPRAYDVIGSLDSNFVPMFLDGDPNLAVISKHYTFHDVERRQGIDIHDEQQELQRRSLGDRTRRYFRGSQYTVHPDGPCSSGDEICNSIPIPAARSFPPGCYDPSYKMPLRM